MESRNHKPLNWGLGLRPQHYSDLIRQNQLPVLEIIADNLIGHKGGPALAHTDLLASRTPVLLHGVGLNLGSTLDLDSRYISSLRELIHRFDPGVVSDHLCLSRVAGAASYELLPVPRTMDSLALISSRVSRVQEALGRAIALENVSAYVEYRANEFSEGEFLSALVKRTGCEVLLDTNNLYVNSVNFGFDALDELRHYPLHAVRQIHVAGHSIHSNCLFDTHDQPVSVDVAKLTRALISELPDQNIPIILEWDDNRTSYEELCQEFSRTKIQIEHGENLRDY